MNIQLHANIINKGSGRPLVFIHGFGATSHTWFKIQTALSSHNELHLVDLKGYGASPRPKDGDYSVTTQAELVKTYLLKNGLKNFTLIGHSYGGGITLLVALELQKEYPGLIRDLILIDSMAYPQKFPWFIMSLQIPMLAEFFSAIIPIKLQVQMVLNYVFYDAAKISQDSIIAYSESLRQTGGRSANIAVARQILLPNIDEIIGRYAELKMPCLIIWGDKDKVISSEIGNKLNKELSNSQLHVINNCGHAPQEECPENVIKIISRFLCHKGGENVGRN